MASLRRWAADHGKVLKGPLGFTREKPPHATTISCVVTRFSLEQFRAVFARWVGSAAGPLAAVTVTVDGKGA